MVSRADLECSLPKTDQENQSWKTKIELVNQRGQLVRSFSNTATVTSSAGGWSNSVLIGQWHAVDARTRAGSSRQLDSPPVRPSSLLFWPEPHRSPRRGIDSPGLKIWFISSDSTSVAVWCFMIVDTFLVFLSPRVQTCSRSHF